MLATQQGDVIKQSAPPVGMGLQFQKSKTGVSFVSKGTQSISNNGLMTSTLFTPQSVGNLGSISQFSILPSPGTVPDIVSESFLDIELTHSGTTGTIDLDIYAANIIAANGLQWQYSSSINQTYDPSVIVLNSFLTYTLETMQVRAAREGINPSTYAPANNQLAVGDTVKFSIPLTVLPYNRNNVWMRALLSELIFRITLNPAAALCTVAGGAATSDLTLTSLNIRFHGYNFADSIRDKVQMTLRETTFVARHIDFQPTVISMNNLVSGQMQTVPLSNNNSLNVGLLMYVRSNTGTPQVSVAPIAAGIDLFTLNNGSSPVPFFVPSTPFEVFTEQLMAPPEVKNPSMYEREILPLPFSKHLSECVEQGLDFGQYYLSQSSSVKITPGTSQSNVELNVVYLRVCNLFQNAGNLTWTQF